MKILNLMIAQKIPAIPDKVEQIPKYPSYQTEGLERLTAAGIIDSPEVWEERFGDTVMVGQMFGILGKLLQNVQE